MAQTRIRIAPQLQQSSTFGSVLTSNTSNEAQWSAPSTGADHIWFYDDSATATVPLSIGTNLSITGTTLNASAGAGGYSAILEDGSSFTNYNTNTTIDFVGSGVTAADAGAGVTSVTLNSFLNTLATQGFVDLTGDVGLTQLPFANMADLSGLSVLGRASSTPGVMAAITAASDNQVLRRSGTSIGFGAINLASSSAVTGVLDETNGGTGQSTFTTGDVLYASAANTLSKLPIGSDNTFLRVNGTVPAWETAASTELSDTANIAYLNGTETISGNWTFSNNITLNATPSAGTDVVNVSYLNSVISGQTRHSVRVATTAAGTLATSFENGDTVDGVVLATNDLILIKDQAAQAENGVYVVQASGAPVRAAFMDTAAEVDGTFVIVEDGTTNAGTFWYTISEVTTLNTDAIVWVRLDKATDITAGAGLSFSGLTLNVGAGDSSVTVAADDISVNLATNSGLEVSTGLKIKPDTVTANTIGLTLTANGAGIIFNTNSFTDSGSETLALASSVAGNGLAIASGILEVNVDDSTMTIIADNLAVKDAGITYAKIQNVNEDRLLGRNAGSAGVVQEISIGSGLAWGADNATIDHADTSSVSNLDTVNAQIIDTLTFDGYGHVTAVTTRNITLNDINDVTITAPSNGQVLTYSSGTWVNSAPTGTVTIGYIEGVTGSSVDLDANDGNLKDVDGSNLVLTVGTEAKIIVYRNGVRQAQSGSVTTRDYDFSAGNVIDFQVALTSADIVVIEQWS